MAYSTCPVTVWVAGTKVQNYRKIGDKHATWTFYELYFISIIVTKKGFLLNCKVQNIDHRHKAKSSFFTFYKYFLYLSVCLFAMKARRLHFSSWIYVLFCCFFFPLEVAKRLLKNATSWWALSCFLRISQLNFIAEKKFCVILCFLKNFYQWKVVRTLVYDMIKFMNFGKDFVVDQNLTHPKDDFWSYLYCPCRGWNWKNPHVAFWQTTGENYSSH